MYEFNLLHHFGVVAKRLRVVAETAATHKRDNNTPSGPTGRGVKTSDIDVEILKSLILCGLWQYFLLNVGPKWYVVVGKYAYVTTFTSKYTGW